MNKSNRLIEELACGNCHTGIESNFGIFEKTPDLNLTAIKFNPDFILNYLLNQSESVVLEMPNFNLSYDEALALTLYLIENIPDKYKNGNTTFSESLKKIRSRSPDVSADEGRKIYEIYECRTCHNQVHSLAKNLIEAPNLSMAATRLQPEFILNHLLDPRKWRLDIGLSRMPSFSLDYDEALALTLFLVDRVPDSLKQFSNSFTESLERIKKNSPNITSEDGSIVFKALNCMACHEESNTISENQKNAPDLSFEGERVTENWLKSYLKNPEPIRPFGYYPGSGGRMPDFNLTDDEVDLITSFLVKKKGKTFSNKSYKVTALSSFSKRKAEKLIESKLPCIGCHELNGAGGKIGPRLSDASTRLKPEYVHEIISNPQHISSDIIMPMTKMPPQTTKLIIDYINQMSPDSSKTEYLSLIEHELIHYEDEAGVVKNYSQYCAPCHGVTGEADGFNKRYLATEPIRFKDKVYMQTRPDDTLYDGIFSGAYILNKSHLMPSWGFTLTDQEIRALVLHIRSFCQCNAPEWSMDN